MNLFSKIYKTASKLDKKIKKKLLNDNTIYLIYTMGKVGSTTVYNTLKKKKPYADIFHAHFLSQNWLEVILPKRNRLFHRNIKIGKNILSFIKNNPQKKIKVITLVREPVIRSLSDLFQNWKTTFEDIENVDIKELQSHIEKVNYDYTLNWFDTEFFEYLNIDIYKQGFNTQKGYEIYSFDNLEILCLKLESLNKIGRVAFNEFLGEDIVLDTANKSSDKKGKEQYEHLKQVISINKEILSELYTSKYVTHFYSPTEINSFIKKWS